MTKQKKFTDSITNIQLKDHLLLFKNDIDFDSKNNQNAKDNLQQFQSELDIDLNSSLSNINSKSYQKLKLINSKLGQIIITFAKRETFDNENHSIFQDILNQQLEYIFKVQMSDLLIVEKDFSLYNNSQELIADKNYHDNNNQMKLFDQKSLLIVNKSQDQSKGCFGQIYKGLLITKTSKNNKKSFKIKKVAVKASRLSESQYKKEGYVINYHRQKQIYQQISNYRNLRKETQQIDKEKDSLKKEENMKYQPTQNQMQDIMQTQLQTLMQTQVQTLMQSQIQTQMQTQINSFMQIQKQSYMQTQKANQQKNKKDQNIVKYYGSFQDQQKKIYLILDYVQNSERQNKSSLNILDLIQKKCLSSQQLFDIMYQIMSALYQLHYQAINITYQNQKIQNDNRFLFELLNNIQTIRDQRKYIDKYFQRPNKIYEDLGVIYRDLKPENILCYKETVSKKYKVKLCDFGVSKIANVNQKYSFTKCGTPLYSSPQITNQSGHSGKTDIWSYGVILLQFLNLQFRNYINSQKQTKQQNIITNVMKFKELYEKTNSFSARESNRQVNCTLALNQILKNCLIQNQQKRWNVKQLKQYMDLAIYNIEGQTKIIVLQNQVDLKANQCFFTNQSITIQKINKVFEQNQRDIPLLI